MKKLMGILLAASMVFSLAACGSTADTAASSAAGTTATAEGSSNNQAPDVKVGAIILGDETEGYSAAHINGIKEAAAELGMSDDQIVWKYKIAEGGVTAEAAKARGGRRPRRRSRGPCRPGLQPDHLQLLRPSDLHGGGSREVP